MVSWNPHTEYPKYPNNWWRFLHQSFRVYLSCYKDNLVWVSSKLKRWNSKKDQNGDDFRGQKTCFFPLVEHPRDLAPNIIPIRLKRNNECSSRFQYEQIDLSGLIWKKFGPFLIRKTGVRTKNSKTKILNIVFWTRAPGCPEKWPVPD